MVNKLTCEGQLNQKVVDPTRGKNILDVVLVKPDELHRETEVIDGISDHEAVFVVVKSKCERKEGCKSRNIKQYHMVDKSGVREISEK